MTFGENIKKQRKKNGLTQEELANKAGIATITLRQYETEKRIPSVAQLQKIAEAMNCDLFVLLEGVELNRNEILYLKEHHFFDSIIDYLEKNPHPLDSYLDKYENEMRKKKLLYSFELLNDQGKEIAVDVVEGLTTIEKYQKEQIETPQAAGEPSET